MLWAEGPAGYSVSGRMFGESMGCRWWGEGGMTVVTRSWRVAQVSNGGLAEGICPDLLNRQGSHGLDHV